MDWQKEWTDHCSTKNFRCWNTPSYRKVTEEMQSSTQQTFKTEQRQRVYIYQRQCNLSWVQHLIIQVCMCLLVRRMHISTTRHVQTNLNIKRKNGCIWEACTDYIEHICQQHDGWYLQNTLCLMRTHLHIPKKVAIGLVKQRSANPP